MRVVCLSAWKRSGKDSVTDHLASKYDAKRVSFANPLKDRVAEEYGINREWLDDQNLKEAPLKHLPVIPQDKFTLAIANLLWNEFRTVDGKEPMSAGVYDNQFVGFVRSNDPNGKMETRQLYWTPRALAIFKGSGNRSVKSDYWVKQAIDQVKAMSEDSLIVISDLRYKSEMTQLKEVFGSNVTFVRINRFDDSPSQDASERDLDDATFDKIIENKSSLDDLYQKADNLMSTLGIAKL